MKMKNKNIIKIVIPLIVMIIAISIPVIFFINKSVKENNLYSSYYTLDENFIIEAENGSYNQKENSIEFIKTAINAGANCVELDLSFDLKGVPYICDNLEEINENTISLEIILKYFSENPDYNNIYIDLHLEDISTDLSAVDKLAEKYGLSDKIFLTNINTNQALFISTKSKLDFYLDYELEKKSNIDYINRVFNDISVSCATGIICEYDDISKDMLNTLKENWVKISFEDVNNDNEIINVLSYSPSRIKTQYPHKVYEIVQNWKTNAPVELYGIDNTQSK